MKPLRLKMQAFGPYVEMQTVDFEKLSQKGMFLIKGPTGSGKTTIFDAMTFALYGGSSGDDSKSKVGRNDLEEWRCNQAGRDTPTVVSFTFSVRGKIYEFTRKLVPKRKNFSEEYSAGEIDEHGILLPFFENPKKDALNKKAEELIGLSKEQFRQVVLLPQGQFERFLTASSEEKEAILEKIFDAQRWDAYAQKFFENASQRKIQLDGEKSEIQRSLEEEKLENLAELETRLTELAARREKNRKDREDFDAEERQRQLNRDIDLAARFEPLYKQEQAYRALLEQADRMAEKEAEASRASAAEGLRSVLLEEKQTQKEYAQREKTRKETLGKLPAAQEASEAARRALLEHRQSSVVAEKQKKSAAYESKRETYGQLESLQQTAEQAKKALNDQEEKQQKAEQAWNTATQNAQDAYSSRSEAEAAEKEQRDRYYAGIYGELASELKEDAPCPVCGSPHHPNPAQKAADSVSKAEVDKAEKAAQRAKKNWEKLEQERKSAEEGKKKADQDLLEANQAFGDANAAWNAAKSQLIEGIPTLKALEGAILRLEQEIRAFEDKTEKLESAADETANKLKMLTADLKNAERECQTAEEKWTAAKEALTAALKERGYADAESAKADLRTEQERSALQQTVSEYKGSLKTTESELEKKRQELSGLEKPDKSQFKARQAEITETEKRFTTIEANLAKEMERLAGKRKKLAKMQAHFDANYRQAEDDLNFAKKLRGDAGIGLQRYVLAILFNQVIAEANRMLAKVHGGRYHLYRSDEKGKGNKRGLELKVYDNRSPEADGRGVAMLSGGEKFLVSLALSIGMSTVAQKGGVQIEALFIDEGFGTLDDNSIHDAMDVLESVRRSSGMIGIISHVQLLESNIPTHLEVVKSDSGSRIRLE